MSNTAAQENGAKNYWLVGASYDGSEDQTADFIRQGVWENGYKDKYLEVVKSVRPGDRIAIKSSYTRKYDLPFDNRGQSVSVMAIKAVGTVTENPGDGRTLKVEWQATEILPREWYFNVYRLTITRLTAGDWQSDALIAFAFDGKAQDVERFRNAPAWRERFGDIAKDEMRFIWTRFYQEVADKLLTFRHRRDELVAGIHEFAARVDGLSHLQDQFDDGSSAPLTDICPFTTIGIFNRSLTDTNRKIIAGELARVLGVTEPVPDSFEGIPLLNNQRSWFFGYQYRRESDDIEALWEIFAQGLVFSASENGEGLEDFSRAYDDAASRAGVGWNLTMGLYWIRPWFFPTLDAQSQHYIQKKLTITIGKNGAKKRCNADDYLKVMETLKARFREELYPVHSFPDLSLAAWRVEDGEAVLVSSDNELPLDEDEEGLTESAIIKPVSSPYSLDHLLEDGCFIAREQLETMLKRLRMKKNLILQGPPGTGKTWLAKRLAYALIGQRDEGKVQAVQFHPNLSYEDFIRGWRPSGEGKLTLVDGPFMEMIGQAARDPDTKHVFVIEEINRGNPAQIFGEMLTLLEADKRTPDEALALSYKRQHDERISIPDNLYVIGTMNIADRSLALVDLALRRRFAFISLETHLGQAWRNWVAKNGKLTSEVVDEIEKRLSALNDEIASDTTLGAQFRVGHSYVTPPKGSEIEDGRAWFREVVETEIGPLLDEYWFDALNKAQKAREKLLEGFLA